MLQAHSYLWHYLWIGPNLWLLGLFFLVYSRKLYVKYPAFVALAALLSLEGIATYIADVTPQISPSTFWIVLWTGLLVEAIAKFFLLGEIFHSVSGGYPALARIGRTLIRAVGVLLVLISSIAASYAQRDSLFGIVHGAHLLEQAMYMIECGVLVFIFLFALHYRLTWDRLSLGIAIGFGIAACVQLADWAITTSGGLHDRRYLFDMINGGAYQLCVWTWYYFVLTDSKTNERAVTLVPRLPAIRLQELNHELEQLLQR
jgi:hypothetical protein